MVWMLSPLVVRTGVLVLGGLAILFHLSRVGSPESGPRLGGIRPWKFNLWQIMALVGRGCTPVSRHLRPADEGRVFSFLLLCLGVPHLVRPELVQ